MSYDVLFYGVVKPGHDPEQARDNLAALFKTERCKVDPLFSGSEVVIKRGVDETTAKRYQAAFAQAGLVCQLREASDAPSAASGAGEGEPTVAESGSRLSPESPEAPPAPDTSHLSAAETGADVLEGFAPPEPPPAPDVSHLSATAEDDNLLERVEREPPPPPPDISHLSASEAEDLTADIERAPPPPAPDTSHLSTAETGADVIEAHEEEAPPPPPDTSHLGMADDEKT
jgi:hypothetical protein